MDGGDLAPNARADGPSGHIRGRRDPLRTPSSSKESQGKHCADGRCSCGPSSPSPPPPSCALGGGPAAIAMRFPSLPPRRPPRTAPCGAWTGTGSPSPARPRPPDPPPLSLPPFPLEHPPHGKGGGHVPSPCTSLWPAGRARRWSDCGDRVITVRGSGFHLVSLAFDVSPLVYVLIFRSMSIFH